MRLFNLVKIFVCLWFALDISSPVQAQKSVVLDSLSSHLGDSTNKRKLTFNGYPYAYYTPETELAFGVGGIMIFYTGLDSIVSPSKTVVSGYYSTLKQYKITLNPAMYFFEDKLFIGAYLSFGHFVDKFWGIGNETDENGTEQYEKQNISASFQI